jgi:DNA-binding protein
LIELSLLIYSSNEKVIIIGCDESLSKAVTVAEIIKRKYDD